MGSSGGLTLLTEFGFSGWPFLPSIFLPSIRESRRGRWGRLLF